MVVSEPPALFNLPVEDAPSMQAAAWENQKNFFDSLEKVHSSLSRVFAEREELGKAAFAAVVYSGVDTDGAQNWREYFRPMPLESWETDVKYSVNYLNQMIDGYVRLQ